jgi:hypothetical protein
MLRIRSRDRIACGTKNNHMEHHSVVSRDEAGVRSTEAIWHLCLRILLRGVSEPVALQLYDELARAELTGDVSEFHALGLYAIHEMGMRSEFVEDYLGMAREVATSSEEAALVTLWTTMYSQLRAEWHTEARDGAEDDWMARQDDALVALSGGLYAMFRSAGIFHDSGCDVAPRDVISAHEHNAAECAEALHTEPGPMHAPAASPMARETKLPAHGRRRVPRLGTAPAVQPSLGTDRRPTTTS